MKIDKEKKHTTQLHILKTYFKYSFLNVFVSIVYFLYYEKTEILFLKTILEPYLPNLLLIFIIFNIYIIYRLLSFLFNCFVYVGK